MTQNEKHLKTIIVKFYWGSREGGRQCMSFNWKGFFFVLSFLFFNECFYSDLYWTGPSGQISRHPQSKPDSPLLTDLKTTVRWHQPVDPNLCKSQIRVSGILSSWIWSTLCDPVIPGTVIMSSEMWDVLGWGSRLYSFAFNCIAG